MSICTGKEGDWACKPIAEKQQGDAAPHRAARRREQGAQDREGAVRRAAAVEPRRRSDAGRRPDGADTVPPAPPGNLDMPTEKDVDKLFDYVEGMVKKFKERIEPPREGSQEKGRDAALRPRSARQRPAALGRRAA